MSHSTGPGSFRRDLGSRFSTRDAFEETEEEAIRIYGTTTIQSNPDSNNKKKSKTEEDDDHLRVNSDNSNRNLKYNDDNTSRDSDSLIQDSSCNSLPIYYSTTTASNSNNTNCWRHPKVRENWKTVLAALTLLIVGSGLIVMGAYAVSEPNNGAQGAVFFVAGFFCFIPGAYHVIYIWLAARGFRGFDFYHLPLFT